MLIMTWILGINSALHPKTTRGGMFILPYVGYTMRCDPRNNGLT